MTCPRNLIQLEAVDVDVAVEVGEAMAREVVMLIVTPTHWTLRMMMSLTCPHKLIQPEGVVVVVTVVVAVDVDMAVVVAMHTKSQQMHQFRILPIKQMHQFRVPLINQIQH